MTVAYLPTPAEAALVARASAHVIPDDMTQPAARWQRGVTDLETARVLLALERGTPISSRGNGRWYAPSGSPLNARSLSITVGELISTGLLIHHVSGRLVASWVHAEAPFRTTACRELCENMGPKRVRLSAQPALVDCPRCLALL